MKRYVCSGFLVFCFLLTAVSGAAVTTSPPSNNATSAILMDLDSGRILFSQNIHEKRSIASITKVMTALVAVEAVEDLNVVVDIPKEWTGAEGSSIYLEAGESLTFETLLYGLLLHSGNDAAVAIANFCAGDEETFVSWMNEKASDLGMTNTHFANPNGLDEEGHYSTAYDMALLAVEALNNPIIAPMLATKSISLEGRIFTNHNKLLWNYEGCIGLKTGYTDDAGRTLITAAQRDGEILIVVTLNDSDDWVDHAALFDYGFLNFPSINPLDGENLVLPLEGSLLHFVSLTAQNPLSYPIKEGETWELLYDMPASLSAPVTKGSIVGEVSLLVAGEVVSSTALLIAEDVGRDVVAGNYLIQYFLEKFGI